MDTRRLELKWEMNKKDVSLTFITEREHSSYSGESNLVSNLPSLPHAISADEPVATVADSYQNLLRSLRRSGKSAPGPNAMESLFAHFGDRNAGILNIRLTAKDAAANLLGFPWELLLHDADGDYLRERLARIAIVRSLEKTSRYTPREMDSQFRVLLLQGAKGNPPLNFEGERKALDAAWTALGMLLNVRIAPPMVRSADLSELLTHLTIEKPHLLWFSGHGRQKEHDFELLFQNGLAGEWRSFSVLSDAIEEANRKIHNVPLIAAFWACDGTRFSSASSSLNAANSTFPVLVDRILGTGVEAVIGVQTQVYDSTARIMGESFFRAIAEGSGPAIALAAARADLHRNPSRTAPGSRSEWTSPVLWTYGAEIPHIKWASPPEANEAIVLHRLGRESLLAVEGGRDVFTEPNPIALPSSALKWCQNAPIWLICRDIHVADRQLSIIREFRKLVLTQKKTVLLIKYDNINDSSVLEALSRNFRALRGRIFPSPGNEAIDSLVILFQAFSGNKRKDAWLRLLRQPELVVAIIAEGGMTVDDDLAAAASSAAKVIVVSNREPTSPSGEAPSGWKVDDIDTDNLRPAPNEPASGLLAALAVFDKPLAQEIIAFFGRDFGLETVDLILRDSMARFGERYVVKASVAHQLLEQLKDDERRAAHRACMNFLQRVGDIMDVDSPTLRAWRLTHALKAGEVKVALPLAEEAIRIGADAGNYAYILEIYKELGSLRRLLRDTAKLEIAFAQSQAGQAQRAYDLLRQIPYQLFESRSDRLHYAVIEAEALRNMQDGAKHQQSIQVLENALRKSPSKNWSAHDKCWWVIARHDLARNLHYFAEDVVKAREIFLDVIKKAGDNPPLAYVRATALRNLSDIYNRYGYGKLQPDKQLAGVYLRQAVDLADRSPRVRSLLPEFLYVLAKLDHSQGRIGDAGAQIRQALDLARTNGLARILGLSTNKLFWWELEPLNADSTRQSFDYSKWQRIEEQLDLLSQDPWVARALVRSRILAAKCLDLQSRKMAAIDLLQKARGQLEAATLFDEQEDFPNRWQPVFAGLALLNASNSAFGSDLPAPNYDEKIWNELRQIGHRITGNTNLQLTRPQQIWEGVT
jgi:hypothetical protein